MRGCIPISERIKRWNRPILYCGYVYDIGTDGHVWRTKFERGEYVGKPEKTNLPCKYVKKG